MQYSVIQWLLFFFLYGFLGWIWECLYVSISERKWINRGFLYGAFIPIYGFGAIIMLFVTLPVWDSISMIFLAGILGSTILEYGTGVVMQKLFQARYWDYGRNRFHLNGHICPLCSLGWGLFSVAQIKILHPLIEPVMLKIPVNTASVISTILVAVYAADTALSVQSAQQMQEKPKNNKMCVIISEIAKRTKFAEDYAQQIMESKIKRCRLKGKQDKELSEKELKRRILEVDKRRAEYYSFIMGQSWGRKHNYDLCVNTTNTGACQVQKL